MQPRPVSHYVTTRSREAKISSADLSSDLDTFMSNGGQIEKLGNTPFRKLQPTASDAETAASPPGGDTPA